MDKQIILKELKYTFARSAGSGGQHVNKVETKVHLSFDVNTSLGLSLDEKALILAKLQNRISLKGLLSVESSKSRSQLKNKKLVATRFFEIIEKALVPDKIRKKSKPTASMIDKRLKAKKQLSEKKNQRKKVKLPKQFDLFLFKCVSFASRTKMKDMNTKFYFLLLALSCLSFMHCGHSDNPERQKAFDEMMQVHDEVMPEISTINKLSRKLKKKIEMTQNQDSLIMMKATLTRLEEAEEGMMDWMHELNVPGKNIEDANAIDYMKKEKDKISIVSQKMKKSILSGKAILGETN